jgi:hypothetical protein
MLEGHWPGIIEFMRASPNGCSAYATATEASLRG